MEHSAAISNCPALTMSGPSKTQVVTVAFLAAHAAIAKLCPALSLMLSKENNIMVGNLKPSVIGKS